MFADLAARAGAVSRVLHQPLYRRVFLIAIVGMAAVLVSGELISVAVVGSLVNHAWPSGVRFNALPYPIGIFTNSAALDLVQFPLLVVLMRFGDDVGLVVAQISLYSAVPMSIMALFSALTVTLTLVSFRENRLRRGEEGKLGGGVAGSVAFVSAGSQMSGILGGCCGAGIPASLATLSASGAAIGASGFVTAIVTFLGRFGQIGLVLGPTILFAMVYHLGGVASRAQAVADETPVRRSTIPWPGGRPQVIILLASAGVLVALFFSIGLVSRYLRSHMAPTFELTRFEGRSVDPSWSPDGRRLAFISMRSSNREIWLTDANGENLQQLTNNGLYKSSPTWSSDGRQIAFTQMVGGQRQIWAVNITNHSMLQLTHGQGFKESPIWNPHKPEIVYIRQGFGVSEVRVIDLRTGSIRGIASFSGPVLYPAWRPDGDSVAFTAVTHGESNIWVVNSDGHRLRQLSHSPGSKVSPTWSPNGRTIAFVSDRNGKHQIWMMRADGTDERLLIPDADEVYQVTWSPDGRRLAYVKVNGFTNARIWVWNRVPEFSSQS